MAQSNQLTTEAEHLRVLLERQPSCLMRIAIDGTMLAVNDAALGLLGGEDHSAVLGHSIAERFVPEHIFDWPDFADRVWSQGAASLECDLIDLAGAKRTTLFQGLALRDHPDNIDSVLVVARDTSTRRELERTLQDDENNRTGLEAARTQLTEALAEQHRLATLLAQAEDERQRAADLLDQRETEQKRLDAEYAADRKRLQAVAEEQQLASLERDRQARDAMIEIQAQLAVVSAERARLQDTIEQHQAERLRTDTDRAAEREQIAADHQNILSRLAHQDEELADARGRLARTLAEQERLTQILEQQDVRYRELQDKQTDVSKLEQTLQEHEAALAAEQRRTARAIGEARIERAAILKQLADQQVDLQHITEQARSLESLAAAGRLARDVSRELSELVNELQERSKRLLELSSLEAEHRPQVETLRLNALRAATLARQFLQPTESRSESTSGEGAS